MSWFTDVMLDIGELKRLIDKTPGTIFYYKMSGIWDKFLLCQYSNETEYLDYLLITISDLEETITDLEETIIDLEQEIQNKEDKDSSGFNDSDTCEECDEKRDRIDALKDSLNTSEGNCDDLKEELIVLQKYNEELKLVNENKQDEIRKLRNKYE